MYIILIFAFSFIICDNNAYNKKIVTHLKKHKFKYLIAITFVIVLTSYKRLYINKKDLGKKTAKRDLVKKKIDEEKITDFNKLQLCMEVMKNPDIAFIMFEFYQSEVIRQVIDMRFAKEKYENMNIFFHNGNTAQFWDIEKLGICFLPVKSYCDKYNFILNCFNVVDRENGDIEKIILAASREIYSLDYNEKIELMANEKFINYCLNIENMKVLLDLTIPDDIKKNIFLNRNGEFFKNLLLFCYELLDLQFRYRVKEECNLDFSDLKEKFSKYS